MKNLPPQGLKEPTKSLVLNDKIDPYLVTRVFVNTFSTLSLKGHHLSMTSRIKNHQPNVLILILSSEEEPWHLVQKEGQDKTFLTPDYPGVKFVRYFGNRTPSTFMIQAIILLKRIQNALPDLFKNTKLLSAMSDVGRNRLGDNAVRLIPKFTSKLYGGESLTVDNCTHIDLLYLPVPEVRPLIGLKTIEAFKFILQEFEFDFVFRTNTSSLVNPKKLISYLEGSPSFGIYAGYKMKTETGEDFASGAGVLLSRDVLAQVCEAESKWRHGLPDDVALADLIKNVGGGLIKLQSLSRSSALTLDQASQLSAEELSEAFHIRCKSESPQESVEIMHKLWKRMSQ